MAERSIGMTTGSGDGDVGGYSSSRMTTMFDSVFGNGILSYGNMFSVSGSGTATLTVASGVAMVDGFFYENTTNCALTITGIANGTYYLVVRMNNTASPVTVVRSEGTGASTTTIAAYTVRIAIVSSVVTSTDIKLYTIAVSGGTWTLSDQQRDFAVTRPLAARVTASIADATSASVASGTASYTALTTNSVVATSNSNILGATFVGGIPRITFYATGYYIIDCMVDWDTNTTGSRYLSIGANSGASPSAATTGSAITAASIVNAFHGSRCVHKATFTISVNPSGALGSQYVELRVAQNSGAARTVAGSCMSVTRM